MTSPTLEWVDRSHTWIGQCANSKVVTDTAHTSDVQYAYVRYSLSIIYSWYYACLGNIHRRSNMRMTLINIQANTLALVVICARMSNLLCMAISGQYNYTG